MRTRADDATTGTGEAPGRKRLHVVLISQYFHPEQFSNTAIALNLVARGHTVEAVCCVPNYGKGTFFDGYSNRRRREEMWNGIAIHRTWTIPRGRSALRLIANYLCYPVAAGWTMLRRLRSRPDVAFVSMPSPLLQAFAAVFLKWLRGVPAVYWVQDIWPESPIHVLGLRNPLIVRPLTWVCGWLYRRADLVLVQSEAFPPMIARFGVPAERIRVLPNTAPDSYRPLAPADAPDEGALMPQGAFRLMFAGNIGAAQDFDTLVAAADLLRDRRDLVWMIVGSGRDMERVQGLIRRRGLDDRFRFLGRHPEERMPRLFAHADAMLVSLTDAPIFRLTVPYKVQCYMACGRPIVASLGGEGARVIEEAGAGLVAEPGQPRALAAAIRAMLDAPEAVRARHGRAARRYFEETYAAETVYGRLERWLAEAAARQTPAPQGEAARLPGVPPRGPTPEPDPPMRKRNAG